MQRYNLPEYNKELMELRDKISAYRNEIDTSDLGKAGKDRLKEKLFSLDDDVRELKLLVGSISQYTLPKEKDYDSNLKELFRTYLKDPKITTDKKNLMTYRYEKVDFSVRMVSFFNEHTFFLTESPERNQAGEKQFNVEFYSPSINGPNVYKTEKLSAEASKIIDDAILRKMPEEKLAHVIATQLKITPEIKLYSDIKKRADQTLVIIRNDIDKAKQDKRYAVGKKKKERTAKYESNSKEIEELDSLLEQLPRIEDQHLELARHYQQQEPATRLSDDLRSDLRKIKDSNEKLKPPVFKQPKQTLLIKNKITDKELEALNNANKDVQQRIEQWKAKYTSGINNYKSSIARNENELVETIQTLAVTKEDLDNAIQNNINKMTMITHSLNNIISARKDTYEKLLKKYGDIIDEYITNNITDPTDKIKEELKAIKSSNQYNIESNFKNEMLNTLTQKRAMEKKSVELTALSLKIDELQTECNNKIKEYDISISDLKEKYEKEIKLEVDKATETKQADLLFKTYQARLNKIEISTSYETIANALKDNGYAKFLKEKNSPLPSEIENISSEIKLINDALINANSKIKIVNERPISSDDIIDISNLVSQVDFLNANIKNAATLQKDMLKQYQNANRKAQIEAIQSYSQLLGRKSNDMNHIKSEVSKNEAYINFFHFYNNKKSDGFFSEIESKINEIQNEINDDTKKLAAASKPLTENDFQEIDRKFEINIADITRRINLLQTTHNKTLSAFNHNIKLRNIQNRKSHVRANFMTKIEELDELYHSSNDFHGLSPEVNNLIILDKAREFIEECKVIDIQNDGTIIKSLGISEADYNKDPLHYIKQFETNLNEEIEGRKKLLKGINQIHSKTSIDNLAKTWKEGIDLEKLNTDVEKTQALLNVLGIINSSNTQELLNNFKNEKNWAESLKTAGWIDEKNGSLSDIGIMKIEKSKELIKQYENVSKTILDIKQITDKVDKLKFNSRSANYFKREMIEFYLENQINNDIKQMIDNKYLEIKNNYIHLNNMDKIIGNVVKKTDKKDLPVLEKLITSLDRKLHASYRPSHEQIKLVQEAITNTYSTLRKHEKFHPKSVLAEKLHNIIYQNMDFIKNLNKIFNKGHGFQLFGKSFHKDFKSFFEESNYKFEDETELNLDDAKVRARVRIILKDIVDQKGISNLKACQQLINPVQMELDKETFPALCTLYEMKNQLNPSLLKTKNEAVKSAVNLMLKDIKTEIEVIESGSDEELPKLEMIRNKIQDTHTQNDVLMDSRLTDVLKNFLNNINEQINKLQGRPVETPETVPSVKPTVIRNRV